MLEHDIEEIREALDTAVAGGQTTEVARLQMTLSKLLIAGLFDGVLGPDSYEEAMKAATNAVKNAKACGDNLTHALALNSLGQLQQFAGQLDEPIQCFEHAKRLFEGLSMDDGVAALAG